MEWFSRMLKPSSSYHNVNGTNKGISWLCCSQFDLNKCHDSSQCPEAKQSHHEISKKKVELTSKQRTLPCERGPDYSFSISQTSQQQSSPHTDTAHRNSFSTQPLLITVTPGWKWAGLQIKAAFILLLVYLTKIEPSSSPPPSKHHRGVSSTGYSHPARDEKAASVSSLLIMQPLRPEVKGCFVMAHGDQGGFCLTPQVLQPKIKMKLQDKWLHWNRLSSRPGKFLHCWDDLTLLICSFMCWEEEERALQTQNAEFQHCAPERSSEITKLHSALYLKTKTLNPPHKSLLKSFFISVFLTAH